MNIQFPVGYVDFHENNALNFQMNRWYSSGCISREELMEVGKRIRSFEDWTAEFVALAEEARERGDLLACATYYRAAQFFTLGDERDENGDLLKLSLYEKCMAAYEEAYKDLGFDYERIPFENGYIPVYRKLRGSPHGGDHGGQSKGTIVLHGGYDSFIQEFVPYFLYFYEAGYDVYMFEGYGQGEVLNRCGMKMRPEWERCTSPVLDHYGLDNVTLIGVSLGGYLAARAAAYDNRIKRVVLYDIIYDFYGAIMGRRSALYRRFTEWLLRHPRNRLWKRIEAQACVNLFGNWLFKQGCYVYGVETLPEYLNCIKQYNTRELSRRITQDVLLLAGASDIYTMYFDEQKAALTNARSVTGRIFTADEHADHHCQVGNLKLALDYILQWIGALG